LLSVLLCWVQGLMWHWTSWEVHGVSCKADASCGL
jgi:hypothetical protein